MNDMPGTPFRAVPPLPLMDERANDNLVDGETLSATDFRAEQSRRDGEDEVVIDVGRE
jgi:hypothetical protein